MRLHARRGGGGRGGLGRGAVAVRHRAARAIAAALAVQLVAAGCGGVRLRSSPMLIQGVFPSAQIAEQNAGRLREEFAEEWALRGRSAPPRQCLALSGGGIRSAAFSIGTLKALQKADLLRHVDVLSSVSGGAYALSWYYANHLRHGDDDGWLTGTVDGVPDAREVGPVAHLEDKGFVGFGEYVVLLVANTLAAPWNLLANGVFGWHLNTTPARPVYEQRIRETFHEDRHMEFGELRELIETRAPNEQRALPTFVINTTAYVDDDRNHLGGRLGNTVFEFTPSATARPPSATATPAFRSGWPARSRSPAPPSTRWSSPAARRRRCWRC